MKREAQAQPPRAKKPRVWTIEDWVNELAAGEALRASARSAGAPKVRETDAARRARFEKEFELAKEQLEAQELRASRATAARRVAAPKAAVQLLKNIRAGIKADTWLTSAMLMEHDRAKHAQGHAAKKPCDACGDIAQALLAVVKGASSAIQSARGPTALDIVDRALRHLMKRQSPRPVDRGVQRDDAVDELNFVEPVHGMTTNQVLSKMGLLPQDLGTLNGKTRAQAEA